MLIFFSFWEKYPLDRARERFFQKNNEILVFICTDARAPIRIFLHAIGQNESVHLKPFGSLYFEIKFDFLFRSLKNFEIRPHKFFFSNISNTRG